MLKHSYLLPTAFLALIHGHAAAADAQLYPAKAVRLIIAYAAGGGTDTVGRVFAQKLTEGLGRQVIVDNRPGAGGNLATEAVVRAAPDGYTLLISAPSAAINATGVPVVFASCQWGLEDVDVW